MGWSTVEVDVALDGSLLGLALLAAETATLIQRYHKFLRPKGDRKVNIHVN